MKCGVANSTAGVVSDAEADELFAPLLAHQHLVLAVSGGSDSVALMHLAAAWSRRHDAVPKLTVLSVDHGLRRDAAHEAATVARWARDAGLAHATLQWTAEKPASGLQAAARAARYQLMSDWCLGSGAQAIVTAHTADDQAETVVMRLARGSGLDGLAGMAAQTLTPWPLLRPLLGVTRGRLRTTLVARGLKWFDDPSNEDERFERIRMRRALAVLEPLGIDTESIALSARRLARASEALDLAARDLCRSAVTWHRTGYGELDLAAFAAAPEELRLRVLQMLVWQLGSHDMPKMAALERVVGWIAGGSGRARTLAGCRIVKRKRYLLLGREPGRIAQQPMRLEPDGGVFDSVWDQRFRLTVHGAQADDDLSVIPFAAINDRRSFGAKNRKDVLPAFVRDGLPVVLNRGAVHCVPHFEMTPRIQRRTPAIGVEYLHGFWELGAGG